MRCLNRFPLLLLLPLLLLTACRVVEPAPASTVVPNASATAPLPATATSLPLPTPTAKKGCYFIPYGIGGDVPVLAAPDVNSLVLRTITMGEKYLIIDRAGEWRVEKAGTNGQFYQIQLDELVAGWVQDMRGGLEGACAPYQTSANKTATLIPTALATVPPKTPATSAPPTPN